MIVALRTGLALGGLLLVFMAFGFLTDTVGASADFGITAEGAHAITSLRADMTAFFGVGGACFLWGAWARRSDPLIIGAALMLTALIARTASLSINGSFEGYPTPMAVELLLGVLGLIGARVLPKGA